MKVFTIVAAQPVLQKIALAPELPLYVSYHLLPVMRKAGDIAAEFEDWRVDLIKSIHPVPSGSEENTLPEECVEEFTSQVREYLNKDVEFPSDKVAVMELDPYVKLSMVEVGQIEWLLEA